MILLVNLITKIYFPQLVSTTEKSESRRAETVVSRLAALNLREAPIPRAHWLAAPRQPISARPFPDENTNFSQNKYRKRNAQSRRQVPVFNPGTWYNGAKTGRWK